MFGGVGITSLHRALDGLSLRQQTISNNLANADTPGFKAQQVQFEDALQQAIQRGQGGDLPLATTEPGHIDDLAEIQDRPRTTTLGGAYRADGNTVDVEREMSDLAETQISYSAATRLMNTKLAFLRSIVSDGRH
jgi:flagellar basal-body rod protein FlgB